jgi:peptidyl-prolyl isomerase D
MLCLAYFIYITYTKTNEKFKNIDTKINLNQTNPYNKNNNKIKGIQNLISPNKNKRINEKKTSSIDRIGFQSTNPEINTTTPDRQYVYFDVGLKDSYKNETIGRIIIELFSREVPKTSLNFYTLCKNKKYKDVLFHRIIKNFMIQGGDITNNNGTGGYSIYGDNFPDENFIFKHNTPGLLSMANSGPNTNGSQFFITTTETPHLDNKHVVFGKIVDGYNIVKSMETQLTDNNDKPIQDCYIKECGILNKNELNTILSQKSNYKNKGKLLQEIPSANSNSPSLL